MTIVSLNMKIIRSILILILSTLIRLFQYTLQIVESQKTSSA